MDSDTFWTLIESAVAAHEDTDARDRTLTTSLSALAAEEIVEFQRLLDDVTARTQSWLMWGAAHRILGWCSDDGFDYFRMWLPSLGRDGFARVVDDPDALAELPQVLRLAGRERRDWAETEWPSWETLDYVADEAYESVAARELPDTFSPRPGLTDERWDFDDPDQAAARLPRLTALFPMTDLQRRLAFDRELADRGITPAAFHFGTDTAAATPQPRAERARAWLSRWRPPDRSGNNDDI